MYNTRAGIECASFVIALVLSPVSLFFSLSLSLFLSLSAPQILPSKPQSLDHALMCCVHPLSLSLSLSLSRSLSLPPACPIIRKHGQCAQYAQNVKLRIMSTHTRTSFSIHPHTHVHLSPYIHTHTYIFLHPSIQISNGTLCNTI